MDAGAFGPCRTSAAEAARKRVGLYMVSWLISVLLALEGQLIFIWLSHMLPNKMWRKELAAAYKENRIVNAKLMRCEEVEGHHGLKRLFYEYVIRNNSYCCIVLSDSFPSANIHVLYEKEHPEVSTPVTDSFRWIKRRLPPWWSSLLVFLTCLSIALVLTRFIWKW